MGSQGLLCEGWPKTSHSSSNCLKIECWFWYKGVSTKHFAVQSMEAPPCNLQDLKDLLLTSWCQIQHHTFKGLVESVPRQWGWPTQYKEGHNVMPYWCKYQHYYQPHSALSTIHKFLLYFTTLERFGCRHLPFSLSFLGTASPLRTPKVASQCKLLW